jgi:hypothetical protein
MDGNLVFVVETKAGRLVQKLYFPRKSPARENFRAALGFLRGIKSSPRAEVRRLTEASQLRHWREQGFDVPRLIEPAAAGLGPGPYNLCEFVEGDGLLQCVRREGGRSLAERRGLLGRYAATWATRHSAALQLNDPRLLQEHGTLEHVIVSGERFVTFDHEQAFRPGAAVLPVVAKEFASSLRSLLKGCGPEAFEELLDALMSGYGNDDLLRSLSEHFTQNPSPLWRRVYAIDRQREFKRGADRGKFAALERLATRIGS